MREELLEILRCPRSGSSLGLLEPEWEGDRVRSAWLVSSEAGHRYPIRNFVPRFVPESNYADNFGMQWNKFRQTQLDSHSGQPISSRRFWNATGWKPEELAGQWVLDVGCGAGRFAEVALEAGAKVVAVDYSSAVDACYANLQHHPGLHVVQGDVYSLPCPAAQFEYVYSLGVLQHTPDVTGAFAKLARTVAPGGRICADFYWRRLRTMLHSKYLLRPLTKRLPQGRLFAALEAVVPLLQPLSGTLGQVPVLGRALKRLVPVADYTGVYALNPRQLQEWSLLDTFDMLAPEYDNPQTTSGVRKLFEAAGLVDVEVFHEGHLVGRGHRPR